MSILNLSNILTGGGEKRCFKSRLRERKENPEELHLHVSPQTALNIQTAWTCHVFSNVFSQNLGTTVGFLVVTEVTAHDKLEVNKRKFPVLETSCE